MNSFSSFFMILAQSTISRSFHSRSLMQFYTKLAPKETSLLQIRFRNIVWKLQKFTLISHIFSKYFVKATFFTEEVTIELISQKKKKFSVREFRVFSLCIVCNLVDFTDFFLQKIVKITYFLKLDTVHWYRSPTK